MSSQLQTEAVLQRSVADSNGSVIKVSHLTKRFVKGVKSAAVNDISFEVGKEIVALFGPSGCGKTTTLRCIAGLEKPDSGEITIGGRVVTSIEKGIFVPPEKRDIGLMFQSYALWPHMKVFDNVAYGLRVRKIPKDEIEKKVKSALQTVELTGYEKRYPAQLSGGQQQRVALARSLVYEPKVLLLDEPLSNLDAKVREKTRIELKSLLSRIGISTVYVTHDQEEAFVLSDRVIIMDSGSISQNDTPYNIYRHPANKFVASFIGRSNLVEGNIISVDSDETEGRAAKGVVRVLGNYDIECSFPSTLHAGEKCLVTVRANEVGLYPTEPTFAKTVQCTVVSRDYKGSMTDHMVKVGDTMLVVSTHRFCDLNKVEGEEELDRKHYLHIRGDSVSIVPFE